MEEGWKAAFAGSFGLQAPHLTGGDSANFDVSLERLNLYGGCAIEVPTTGVTAIVGANNAGKSTLLREVVDAISRHPSNPEVPRLVLEGMQLRRSGEVNDVIAWIGDHSTFVLDPQQARFQTSRGATLYPSNIAHAWQTQGSAIGEIAQIVVHFSHAQDRFSFGGSTEMRASIGDPATHPVHRLQDSRELLEQLNEITESVFKQRLTLDGLGRILQLRVGTVEVAAPPIDNISTEYRDAMSALPTLEQQGDGMRGFMGQLLPLVTSSFKIIALDEPEAFLHPPQAYGLGQQLGQLAVAGQVQVIVATHDRNLVAGLLDSGVDVSIVRLERKNTTTSARSA